MESDKDTIIVAWMNALKRAADFDAWGQPVEAIDVYERLSKQLRSNYESHDDSFFSECQKKTLEKIALCLDSRRRVLQLNATHPLEGVPLVDLRRLEQAFQTILHCTDSDVSTEFPVDVTLATAQLHQLSFQSSASLVTGEGTLLPKPLPIAGKTLLSIKIEKVDLKDASQYLDPFITVSVRDGNEKLLSASQDTPVVLKKTEYEVIFNKTIHIQKTIESLPPGFAIFFEFKHYKPKKESISTKCWAFLEQDELKEGHLALEIYRKPADFSRKALKLLSVKPHYLHLQLTLFR